MYSDLVIDKIMYKYTWELHIYTHIYMPLGLGSLERVLGDAE